MDISPLPEINAGERILILAPHPDDEAIGCAGLIQHALAQGARVRVGYLTNGDHNEIAFIVFKKDLILRRGEFIKMGHIRRGEAIKAMQLLGIPEDDLIFGGYPDFGTFAMFSQYWQSKYPYKSLLTRISSVPYKDSPIFGKQYFPENVLTDLKRLLLSYKPDKIFVSHPADVNVDHKAFYLFLQVALADLHKDIPAPKVYSYLIHWRGWPLPRNYHPNLMLVPPGGIENEGLHWFSYALTPEELENKHKVILCYRSQTASSAFYLLSFARGNELFSDNPDINLFFPSGGKVKEGTWLVEKILDLLNFGNKRKQRDFEDAQGVFNSVNSLSYGVEGKNLLVYIKKANVSSYRRVATSVYLFGYSYKKPFAQMPKIKITTKFDQLKIFNGTKLIEPQGVSVNVFKRGVVLKVPLSVLGEPDFVLSDVWAYTGSLPVYATGFRKLNITDGR